jgi:uncharacterized protein (TIGR03437 family)
MNSGFRTAKPSRMPVKRILALLPLACFSLWGQGIVTTVAGTDLLFADEGRPATQAQLISPHSLAFDARGRLHISDRGLNQVLRLEANGSTTVVAGNGLFRFAGDGGSARAASLGSPLGILFEQNGVLVIADNGNGRIRVVLPDGMIDTGLGPGGNRTGENIPVDDAGLNGSPVAITFDRAGNFYFIEQSFAGARVRKVTLQDIVSTVAGTGMSGPAGDGGPAIAATLNGPQAIAVDAAGNLYIADTQNNRIRRVGPDGVIQTVVGGGSAAGDGVPAAQIRLNRPAGLAIDPSGRLHIADTNNHRILQVTLSGTVNTVAGAGTSGFSGDGGAARQAQLNAPVGIAFDASGNLFIADSGNARVRRLDTGGIITTAAGRGVFLGDNAPAAEARLFNPVGVAIDSGGALIVADWRNHRVRKVSPGGVITTVAGDGRVPSGLTGDGGQAANAPIGSPFTVAADAAGNVYFADLDNNAVRRVAADGTLSTLVTTQTQLEGQSASLAPLSMTVDAAGNLVYSSAGRVIRRTPSGVLTVIAGVTASGFGGDGGPATSARFSQIRGLAYDAAGNLYVCDFFNSRVRKVDRDGIVTTFAGTGQFGDTGDGGPATSARITMPTGVAVDRAGNVYIAAGQRIRRVDPSGIITAYAGSGVFGFSGDGGTAGSASFSAIEGLALDSSGNLYAADSLNNRIRLIQSGRGGSILLSQRGMTFAATSAASSGPQQLTVVNGGIGTMSWSARATITSGGREWLSANPARGESPAGMAGPPIQVTADPTGLAPGEYYGQIEVRSPSAPNSPQVVTVILRIGNAALAPTAQPSGLLFTAAAGGQNPPAQSFSLLSTSATASTYQATASFGNGRPWFTLNGASGNVRAGQPVALRLDPAIAGFQQGVYDAAVTVAFSGGPAVLLRAVLVVAPAVGAATASKGRLADGCAATRLVPLFISLGQGFAAPTGFPSPVELRVVDDCAHPMSAGSVDVTFSNGDPPLSLTSLRDGRWTGTWQARTTGDGSIRVTAQARLEALAGTAEIAGSLRVGENPPPLVASGGVLNAGSFQLNAAVAPGSLVSVFGQRMADGEAQADALPLPVLLAGTRVSIGGRSLPLVFSSPNQVNAVVPFDIAINATHQLVVRRGTALSIPEPVSILGAQSGIFTKDRTGRGEAIVVVARQDGTQALASPDFPAHAGDVLVIYCTGLGEVNPRAIAGSATPATPLSPIVEPVTVTLGGVDAEVLFAGLTPGFTGLYQINAVVPAGIQSAGPALLVIRQDGKSGPPVLVPIQ